MDVGKLREQYPKGTVLELRHMEGEDPFRMHDGLLGEVTHIDDAGQIHIHWDNGSSLALDPELDSFEVTPYKHIKVLVCEPRMMVKEAEIRTDLSSLQRVVGGLIETYYPFDDDICIVCNDEGKLNGMALNRAIRDDEGKVQEVIAGPFFICGVDVEDFCSLSPEQLRKYGEMFRLPEEFFWMGKEIMAIPFVPIKDERTR